MIIERLFVLGPSSQLTAGIVSAGEVSRWKAYLEREGQPLLSCPLDFKSILRVKRFPLPTAGAPQVAFILEYDDPDAEGSLFPGVVTWRMYFRDVHGIEADSTSDLVLAQQLAGWSDQRIARYSAIELDEAIDDDALEHTEYNDKMIEFAEADDVYVKCAWS
ncbi:MAG: hypothetical protein L0Z50_22645 [Verrucomicrobiales bacterium]|nr:hypothetical protein [Verrucomicrobiales bacterium]